MVFNAANGMTKAVYDTILDMFWTHDGEAFPFLVKNWIDYDVDNQPMTGTVGGNDTFGLVTHRDTGNRTKDRPIKFPDDTSGWTFTDGDAGPSLSVSSFVNDQITFTTNPTAQPYATVPLYWTLMSIQNDWLPAVVDWEDKATIPQVEFIEEFIR